MNASEFRKIIESLGLNQVKTSRLLDVTPRAVGLWLSGEREISGPVASYLSLLISLPRALQEKELATIKQEGPDMYEGMYKFNFQGRAGAGLGVCVLTRGKAFGSDGEVLYDGHYEPSRSRQDFVDVHFHLTVPPGVSLVQGVPPQPVAYGFDVDCSFHARGTTPLEVYTPFGTVSGKIEFLRQIPA